MDKLQELIEFLRNQFKDGFFWSKLINTNEISDPIVKAINNKEPDLRFLYELIQKVRVELETIANKETTFQAGDVQVEVDTQPFVDAIKSLESKMQTVINVEPTPVQVNTRDYTQLLTEIKSVLTNLPQKSPDIFLDNSAVVSALAIVNETLLSIKTFNGKTEFKFDDEGNLKVVFPKQQLGFGGGTNASDKVRNASGVLINPATAEKQDEIITALGSIGGDHSSSYGTNQSYESGTVTYLCKTNTTGDYLIKKIDDSDGSIGWATVLNNPSVTTYADAVTNRATLTYGRKDQAF